MTLHCVGIRYFLSVLAEDLVAVSYEQFLVNIYSFIYWGTDFVPCTLSSCCRVEPFHYLFSCLDFQT